MSTSAGGTGTCGHVPRTGTGGLICAAIIAVLLLVALPANAERPGSKLSLSDALQMALAHSYDVKAAERDSISAQYQEAAAQALRYPALSLSAVAFRVDERQKITLAVGPLSAGSIEIGSLGNYQADAKLNLPLFTGGKINGNIKLKQEQLLAAAYGLDAQRLSTAYNCRKAYLGLLLSDYYLGAAQASLKRIDVIRKNVSNLYQTGLADSLDLLEVELARLQATDYLDNGNRAKANARAALSTLLGVSLTDSVVAADTVPQPDLTDSGFFERNQQKMQRPEIAQLEQQIKAVGSQAAIIRADQFPSLYGYVGYTGGKPNRDFFNATWNDYFQVGAALSWNLNLASSTAKEASAVRQQQRSLDMKREALKESLDLLAQTKINEGRYAFSVLKRAYDEFQVAQRKYRLAQDKQTAGQLSVNDLLEQEADLTRTEQLYQAAKISYYLAISEYLYAVGSHEIYGGF
jgi:outer membrane protein